MKMSKIKVQKKNSGNLQHLKNFDPGPVAMKDRDEYPGEFRSVWLNSQMPDLPIRQLYLPANMY